MKIGYFADGRWAHRALDKMLQAPWLEIAFIVGRHNAPDPVLQGYAERMGVPYLLHPNVNSPEFLGIVEPFACDMYVSLSFNQVFKAGFFTSVARGVINCHAGALPFYRGRNVLNWALINGETRFGVTVHHVDEGIDSGDIILQRFAEITPDDNYGSVLDKAVELCAETMFEALSLLRAGRAPRVPQASIHPVGFYCGMRRAGDEWIDWTWRAERVHNFVRGIASPGPGSRTLLAGRPLAILASQLVPGAPGYIGTPGEVVGRDADGILVQTGTTALRIASVAEVHPGGGLGEPRKPAFPIGTRFQTHTTVMLEELEKRVRKVELQLQSFQVCPEDSNP